MSDPISNLNGLYLPDYDSAGNPFTATEYFVSDLNTALLHLLIQEQKEK